MADIDFGQLSEALNNKSDRDLRNVDTTAKADAVIDYQEPTSANNYTWYRKYKSGWVEQGGKWTGSLSCGQGAEINPVITLPIKMANDNSFYFNASVRELYLFLMGWYSSNGTTVTTRFGAYTVARTLSQFTWFASGMAAN